MALGWKREDITDPIILHQFLEALLWKISFQGSSLVDLYDRASRGRAIQDLGQKSSYTKLETGIEPHWTWGKNQAIYEMDGLLTKSWPRLR